ncbi:recombinase RecT [Rhodococcus sp. NPDC019627]|uniref:recombinase RecT n=1 Tax=unclassified Rhodococcus (in: high G+C Gram-positive bacteria) TaxID=192944 RepID=UPI0037A61074
MSENEATSTDVELVDARSTELTITPDQASFTEAQLSVLRQLGVENAPAGDIDLFFHQAKRTGLDPFAKQIYMIGRRTNQKKFDDASRKWVDNWVTVYTIQTGIDGYRVLGHRTARARGDELEVMAPLWRGRDTGWDDVWLGNGPPAAAKVCIVVNGMKYVATALYSEYVQTSGSGDNVRPNSMWRKMPANQLAKCAEAAAWRLAYPSDFSGMVLEDAVQVIDEHGALVETRTRVESRRGAAGLRERMLARKAAEAAAIDQAADPAPSPSEDSGPAAEAETSKPAAEPDTGKRADLLHAALRRMEDAGYATDEQRGAFLTGQLGRAVNSWDDVTTAELADVVVLLDENAAESAK